MAIMALATVAATACGSIPPAGGGTPSATGATATAPPCTAVSSSAHPIGAAQALSAIPVLVRADVPVSAGVKNLGRALCVTVGVGQMVSVRINARVPPWPAEVHTARAVLSTISITPSVPSDGTALQPGDYTLTFTAQSAGATAITYLAATCALPPGVC